MLKAIRQVLKVRAGVGDRRHRRRLHRLHDPADQEGRHAADDAASRFKKNPHAWVKLWKHHAAQPEADRDQRGRARERNEAFLKYYSGLISSEWMLPKCWEIARKAPDVYRAADLIIDARRLGRSPADGRVHAQRLRGRLQGTLERRARVSVAGVSDALDPALRDLDDKWLKNIVAPGRRAGVVSREFARKSGLKAGTPVSAATIDAHSGVPGMGVSGEGPLSIIMGTSSCHMALSRKLRLFDGYAGVVKDGIIPGFYGYESGQSAVGDIFALVREGLPRTRAV